ncbi:MAG: adenylyltransferase/cytidyltransferase family protein [Candidatus Saccharibacteria bacterium]|nr:adenylyltransferase/cytidyltransferase family protein [Candidatus Saccharibacteria bacterium]
MILNKKPDQQIIGYTAGVFDLFHIGHLNLLKNAKGMCDKLIVGVTVDELVTYKGKHAMIPFEDRIEIVRNVKCVDAAIPQYDMDKLSVCKKLGASILFVGDDWYATDKWEQYEKEFNKAGIKIVYFPYTKGVSSTKISKALGYVRDLDAKEAEKHKNEKG